jgi:hypothetical protein
MSSNPMIIQRKQYGCVQMLLVQIGLALYVIVVFLSQGADGSVVPKVLKVQKVAEANQIKLASPAGTIAISAAEEQIIALLSAPQTDAVLAPVALVSSPSADNKNLFSNTSNDLNSLGSKPRAPSVIA